MIGRRYPLSIPILGLLLAAASLVPATHTLVSANPPQRQWMVVSNVYQGGEETPAESHQIAFQNGVYYDFPADRNQPWTIFDLPRSQVVLLDRHHRQRTSLPTDDLVRLTAQAQAGITDPDQRARFGMDAQPTSSGELRFALSYPDTEYQVLAVRPASPDAAAQYGRFVDWVCRLNIARPRGVPPFARMKLNELMTSQNVIPQQTSVTLTRHLGARRTPATIQLRSETTLHEQIDDDVIGQIQDAQTMRVVFQEVPWDEYEH